MYIRPDGKSVIAIVVDNEVKEIYDEMRKNGEYPQVKIKKGINKMTSEYKYKTMKGNKNV